MIIDAHSHWLPEQIVNNAHFFSKAWSDIEDQLKAMEKAGIDKAVLSYPTTDAHLKLGEKEVSCEFNDTIAKILKRFPDKFIGAAILPLQDKKETLDELKRSTGELGFRAISLASSYNGKYLDDPVFLPIYREAQEKNLPVFVHSQIVNPIGFERVNDPLLTPVIEYIFDMTMCVGKLLMSGILSDYKVKFIFANFGGAIPFLQHRFDATYRMLRGINFVKDLKADPTQHLKNIYADTGGDTTQANFLLALELFGPGHLVWGSDWPAKKDIAGSIKAVRDLQIGEKDKEDILGSNLENILEGV